MATTLDPQPQRLRGKTCIVTGSSSGLGRAIALAYAREGAAWVVCADLRPSARAEVESEAAGLDTDALIRSLGKESGTGSATDAFFVKTDVSKTEDMKGLIEETVKRCGRVDVIVNNAGVSLESRGAPLRVHETPDETFDLTMAINTRSVFLGCKHALAQMVKQEPLAGTADRGWIINMSSIYGLVGGWNNVSYGASKGAVTNMSRSVALDYAKDGIHCNAICPGYTETAIFKNTVSLYDDAASIRAKQPLHGLGTPEDIAAAAVFLASPEARFITGINLPVDGGFTAQ